MSKWYIDGKVTAQRCIDRLRWLLENSMSDGQLAAHVNGAVVWDNTPQGYDVWNDLHRRLVSREKHVDVSLRLELALLIEELQQYADRMEK